MKGGLTIFHKHQPLTTNHQPLPWILRLRVSPFAQDDTSYFLPPTVYFLLITISIL